MTRIAAILTVALSAVVCIIIAAVFVVALLRIALR